MYILFKQPDNQMWSIWKQIMDTLGSDEDAYCIVCWSCFHCETWFPYRLISIISCMYKWTRDKLISSLYFLLLYCDVNSWCKMCLLCRSCAGPRAGDGCVVCHSPAWVKDIQINRQLGSIVELFCGLESLLNPTEQPGRCLQLCSSLKAQVTIVSYSHFLM